MVPAPQTDEPPQPRVADRIAARLAEAGCRHAFGMPGGEVLTLVDALEAAGIRFILAKHENAAGFMAEGMHHATGAPALLVATLGPGVANAVNVVANAWQDRVPLVFLTGCVDAAEALSFTHQIFDHGAVLAPLVKATFRAGAEGIDTLIDKALALCLDGQPGPVHIDVPVGVAGMRVTPRPVRRAVPAPMAPAPGPALAAARDLFARAERPVLLAGVDVLNQGAEAAVADFARRFGIPVLTSYKAKGVLPEHEPLALGGAGLSPRADRLILPFLAASDLVILAGYDPIEMRAGWRDFLAPGQAAIEFTAVPNSHYMHQAGLSFVGAVAAGLASLGDGMSPRPLWSDGAPARLRAALAAAFAPEAAWGPGVVFDTMRRLLPAGTVATADSGAHRILLSQMWRCEAPRGLVQSTGLCTMGCALPLALGLKLADPARPVVAFVGDAGLEMVLGELATARDLGLAVIVVVLVDGALGLIELKQRAMGLTRAGVDFGSTDFAATARALGGNGIAVADRAGLEQAVMAALTAPGFTVIAAALPPGSYDGRF